MTRSRIVSVAVALDPERRRLTITVRKRPPKTLRSEDRYPWPGPRRRLMRNALATLVPVPGQPGEFARLNVFNRALGRMSGPVGAASTDWTRWARVESLDPRFALRVRPDGTILLFEEATAPWLSRRLELAYRRRVALVLGLRKPTRGELTALSRLRRAAWRVISGAAVQPGVSAAKLAVIRGGRRA